MATTPDADMARNLVRRIADTAWAARDASTRATGGDRPLLVGLLGVLVLAIAMLSAPLDHFLDGRARVDALEAQARALDDANAGLAQRAEDLSDPDRVELLAREQLGMVMPGEIPFAIVPPEVDRPRIADPRAPDVADVAWYERVWDAVAAALGG